MSLTYADRNRPVAVIGAGAGGLPAAMVLSANKIPVLLVDRGPVVEPKTFATDRYDYELQPRPWLDDGNEWSGPVKVQRAIGVGGSTLAFQGVSLMPQWQVLKHWGLPIEELRRIEQDVHAIIQTAGNVQPYHALNPVSRHLLESARKLGWPMEPARVAILSRRSGRRMPCNYCGLCVYGCRVGDKGSTNNTWLPRAEATGYLRVLPEARVEFLELAEKGRVGAIHVRQGARIDSIPVRAVVLAAGALETPRLLKTSQQKWAWDGIGNTAVGRYLTGTLWRSQLVSVPVEAGGGHAGIPVDIVADLKDQGIRLAQGRNLAGIYGPVSAARVLVRESGLGQLRERMRQHYPRLAGLSGFAESSTDAEDGIVDFVHRRFEKALRDADHRRLTEIDSLLEQWRIKAGAEQIDRFPDAGLSGAMLRGTCRIGRDPKESAVTPDGRLRGYENMVISDASVLGRGLISDASLTLQVLGYYFGRELAKRILT